MKKQIIIIASLFVALGVAYSQHDHSGHAQKEGSKMDQSKHSEMKMEDGQVMTDDVSIEFKEQLTAVYKSSLKLTDHFISGKVKDISNGSLRVKEALKKVDMSLLKSSEAHMEWMMNLKEMNTALEKMIVSTEVKDQKVAYASLSQALYKSVKVFGTTAETVYYQHCPMALDNQGAFWLSDSEVIRNPYFEGKMLTCGSTKGTID